MRNSTGACAYPRTSRRRLHPEDRSVILLVSNKSFSSWALCAYANRMICAHGAIGAWLACASTDSLTLDYVASGSNRSGIAQIVAIHKQKRDNREGYLSFVGGPTRTRT